MKTHCSLRLDHVVWPLAAAAVFHGIPGLLVEDDAEEEDKGTLEGGQKREGKGLEKTKKIANLTDLFYRGSEGLTCRQLNPANR